MTTWHWNTKHDTAFNDLKKKFTDFHVLLIPNDAKPFKIEADTSLFATSAVLYQHDLNNIRHPMPSYLNPSPLLNGIIKYTIMNSSALSMPFMPGNIIFKNLYSQLLF